MASTLRAFVPDACAIGFSCSSDTVSRNRISKSSPNFPSKRQRKRKVIVKSRTIQLLPSDSDQLRLWPASPGPVRSLGLMFIDTDVEIFIFELHTRLGN